MSKLQLKQMTNDSTEEYTDDIWCVDQEGDHIGFRLADYTPHGVYSELQSVFSDRISELQKQVAGKDHIVIGEATLVEHKDGVIEVINVESNLEDHEAD